MRSTSLRDGPVHPTPDTRHPTPKTGRTLRFAVRAVWDAIGLVGAVSLTLFVAASIPAAIALTTGAFGRGIGHLVGPALGIGGALALLPALYVGACGLAHLALAHEEAAYLDLWRLFTACYGQAFLLGVAQILGTAVLAANIVFYLSWKNLAMNLPAIPFLYLLLFWWMNSLYHGPLLAAGAIGILRNDTGGRPGLRTIFRNGFLLAVGAPGFTFALLLVIMTSMILLALSGVGMALLGPGFAAFLTTQATRDQLVRFGVLTPLPDPDLPVAEEGWTLR